MTHSSLATDARTSSDPRRLEAIRFLIHGGLLPAQLNEQFWKRLKFVVQAKRLGLSLADIRRLLEPCDSAATGATDECSGVARTAVAS